MSTDSTNDNPNVPHLAAVAGSVAYKLEAAKGKLCAKTCIRIIKEAIAQVAAVPPTGNVPTLSHRVLVEQAAAVAFDKIWAALPLPFAIQFLRTDFVTQKYIRPHALWAIDTLIDDAYAELYPNEAAPAAAPPPT